MRTLRHTDLGELLLGSRASTFTPAWSLRGPYAEQPVLPTCGQDGGGGTGEHRKAAQDTVGWSWSGEAPTVQGGMVSVWLLRQGRRRSAGAGLGSGPLPAIPPGRWSIMGNPGQRPGLSARGSNPASVFARCVTWGRHMTPESQQGCPAWPTCCLALTPCASVSLPGNVSRAAVSSGDRLNKTTPPEINTLIGILMECSSGLCWPQGRARPVSSRELCGQPSPVLLRRASWLNPQPLSRLLLCSFPETSPPGLTHTLLGHPGPGCSPHCTLGASVPDHQVPAVLGATGGQTPPASLEPSHRCFTS